MYKLYNSFFVIFGIFVIFGSFVVFVTLGFWDFYIYIYYTCRSLTRVGLLHVRRCCAFATATHVPLEPEYKAADVVCDGASA